MLSFAPAAWVSRSVDQLGWLFGREEARPPAGPVLDWAWSGAVTTGTATVVARTRGLTAPLVAKLRDAAGTTTDLAGTPVATAPGVFRFAFTGLRPSTEYVCGFATAAAALPAELRFRTFSNGAQDVRVVFGSCAGTGSNSTIFDTMRARRPDLFVHMGDFHYENIRTPDVTLFRRAFDRVLMTPRQAALYRSTPIAYVWDDHDYGTDEADRTAPSAPAAHQAYRECVPHYPLTGGPRGTLQQALTIGRVRLIVTDARSGRDPITGSGRAPGDPSLLGAAQRAWLLAELEAAREAPLVVWANPVPWITKANERTPHGWAPFAAERRVIADRIDALGLTGRLVMISGDAHMIAIDDGTNSLYATKPTASKGFPVIHGASFDRFRNSKGGPYSHGYRPHRGQFGQLDIKDNGTTITVTATCCDKAGVVVKRLEIQPASVNRSQADGV